MESVLVRNLWLLFTTKEETKRAIEEEAAKLEVALKTRVDERDATLRGQRFEERLKFREGLYSLLKAKDRPILQNSNSVITTRSIPKTKAQA